MTQHEERESDTTSSVPSDARAVGRLAALAYEELRATAHRHLAAHGEGDGRGHTLDTTALVHEAYLKLATGTSTEWRDEAHFRAVASLAMRHILVDRARARAAVRHGGTYRRISLDDSAIADDGDPELLLAIDAALERLSHTSPRLGRLVELRFFGGLSEVEVALELGVTVRTIQRDWIKARALLEQWLRP